MSAVSQRGHLAVPHTCALTCCVPVSVQGCLHAFPVHCLLVAWACLFVLAVFREPGGCMRTLDCMHAVSRHRHHIVGQHSYLHLYVVIWAHVCVPAVSLHCSLAPSQHCYPVIWAFWFAPLMCPRATAWHHGNDCLQAVYVQLYHMAVQTVFYSVPAMLHRVSQHGHAYLHTCCVQVMSRGLCRWACLHACPVQDHQMAVWTHLFMLLLCLHDATW